MKKKTASKIISAKINDWIKSIKCEKIKTLVLEDVIVAGGCITSLLSGETPNDYDVYFKNMTTAVKVTEYYAAEFAKNNPLARDVDVVYRDTDLNFSTSLKFNILNVQCAYAMIKSDGYVKHDGTLSEAQKRTYQPAFISSNAVTLSNDVQLILRFSGEPEEILSNFDFQHTKQYWTKEEGVVTNIASLEAIMSKELNYTGSKYPLCSVIRTRKFINRGWNVNAGQLLTMILQCNELDLHDPLVLIDQLVGVDSNYFVRIIEMVTKEEKMLDGKIDKTYLLEAINAVFDE